MLRDQSGFVAIIALGIFALLAIFGIIVQTTIGYFLPDIKIKGINKGKGNFNSISKQITTKLDRGTIKSIKKYTGYKMIIGHSIDWFPSEIIQSALKGAERSLNKDDNGYVSPNVHIR